MKLSMTATSTSSSTTAADKINIQHLIPRFVENSDISTYFKIFERQCEQVNIGEVYYVTHLLPLLPIDISHIILREPKYNLENYQHNVRRTSFHSKINKQIRTVDKAKEENQENHLEDIRNLKAEIFCPTMDVESPATSSQNALAAILQRVCWRMRANVMRTNANILPCRAVPAVENFLWNEIDEEISL
ncbi:hypothetical protein TNCV_2034821 [Trichonephila clavipes]|nr:hypothetical protein TNCV_2034821 [Trichonephila clavipes]